MVESTALKAVSERLHQYDGLRVERSSTSVIVLAETEDEFDIRIVAEGDLLMVQKGEWRRTFSDLESAWSIVSVGLSTGSRLGVEPDQFGRAGCWLEILLPDGSWRTLPEPGFEPDRSNSSVYYRQNNYLRASYFDQAAFRSIDSQIQGRTPMTF